MTQASFEFGDKGRKGSAGRQRQKWSKVWTETEKELSKPYTGNCSICGEIVRCFPFTENEMLRAIVICPCCSWEACRCRTPREKQMDAALAIVDAGQTWQRAANAAHLEPSEQTRQLIEFWAKERRLETTQEYSARCCA